MESDRVVVIFIHISGWFMCMTLIMLPVHVAGLENVEQRQVYMKSELPNNLVISEKRTFNVLKQPQECSYRELKKCHSNEDMHEAYYEGCYSDVCSLENYFCVNVPDGNSMHLCGQTYAWSKRHRNIVVLDLAVSRHIDVYRTACPVGYFQENRRNAFTTCVKDESITVVRNATNHMPALWRCNTQKNYCNDNGGIFFELDSDEDSCVDAKLDLKIKCSPTEELMPNCSCVPKCRADEERILNGTNICRLIGESGSTDQVPDHVTEITKSNKPSSQRTTPHQTSQLSDRNRASQEEDLFVKDFERQSTDSFHVNHTAMTIGLVAIGIILAVAVVAIVLCFIWKHKTYGGCRTCNTVSQRRSPDDHKERLSVRSEHEDTRNEGQVKSIRSTKVGKNLYNVYAETATVNFQQEVQGNIQPGVHHAPAAIDLEASSGDTQTITRNGSSSEPLMQYLKENDEMQSDSGISSASQTYVKTVE